jgi:hypothetical protein
MNKLNLEKKTAAVGMLCEGGSTRATVNMKYKFLIPKRFSGDDGAPDQINRRLCRLL